MDISKAFKEEKLMKALTGASLDEFQCTANSFKKAIESFYPPNKGNISLKYEQKCALAHTNFRLFFILFYLRFNPSCRLIGFLFGMSRGQAYYWIKKLRPYLSHILCHNIQPCCTKTKSLKQLTEILPEIKELLSNAHKVYFNASYNNNKTRGKS